MSTLWALLAIFAFGVYVAVMVSIWALLDRGIRRRQLRRMCQRMAVLDPNQCAVCLYHHHGVLRGLQRPGTQTPHACPSSNENAP